MPKCYQAKLRPPRDTGMTHDTCFHHLKAKMIIGQISQNMLCAGENRLFQVVFNQALVW